MQIKYLNVTMNVKSSKVLNFCFDHILCMVVFYCRLEPTLKASTVARKTTMLTKVHVNLGLNSYVRTMRHTLEP